MLPPLVYSQLTPLNMQQPTSQPHTLRLQGTSNSLSNALAGEEVFDTSRHTNLLLTSLQAAVITGYQLSHMVHIPQRLYIPRTYESGFNKEAAITFAFPGNCGITLDAALRYNVPKVWETESVDCFTMAKKITIRVLVSL